MPEAKETESNVKLVDRPLCIYFETYKIDAHKYRYVSIMFDDKNPSEKSRSTKTKKNTMVSNFQLVFRCNSLKMKRTAK